MDWDWKVEIGLLWKIKEQIAEADRLHIYEHRLPGVAATDEQIQTLRKSCDFPWDETYVDFLRHANGWSNFLQNTRLFGTADYAGGALLESVKESLQMRLPIQSQRFDLSWTCENCTPIGGSTLDLSVYVIEHRSSNARVGWLKVDEVDAYENFKDFFAAMREYNKRVLQRVISRNA